VIWIIIITYLVMIVITARLIGPRYLERAGRIELEELQRKARKYPRLFDDDLKKPIELSSFDRTEAKMATTLWSLGWPIFWLLDLVILPVGRLIAPDMSAVPPSLAEHNQRIQDRLELEQLRKQAKKLGLPMPEEEQR